VLEVGCGTGLVLQRIASFAKRAVGMDLSPGMLDKARARGLEVVEGSATELPFADSSFDVCCSFKVLPHVPQIDVALTEMARVTRPGGVIIAEFYNPDSFRGLIKRFGPKQRIAAGKHEGDVFTRFDTPAEAGARAPEGCRFIDSRGIRIAVPFGALMQVPGLRSILRTTERALCDSPMQRFAGFWVAAYLKEA
jgi:SAM-dependent methyltransferase